METVASCTECAEVYRPVLQEHSSIEWLTKGSQNGVVKLTCKDKSHPKGLFIKMKNTYLLKSARYQFTKFTVGRAALSPPQIAGFTHNSAA